VDAWRKEPGDDVVASKKRDPRHGAWHALPWQTGTAESLYWLGAAVQLGQLALSAAEKKHQRAGWAGSMEIKRATAEEEERERREEEREKKPR